MKKILSIIFFISISTVVMSGPYLMSKHEFKMKDTDYSSTINHIRFGNSWKSQDGLKLYGEIGVAESVSHGNDILDGVAGKSYEFGFSKKVTDEFSWKGKWEGLENHNTRNSHKIEIKTKWEF
jgi:hypothetical protein